MKNKIFIGFLIVILIGIVVVAVAGFNVDFVYKNHHLVDIKIGQDFNISDIETIVKEVFPNEKFEVQKAGVYSDNVVIKVEEISEEQKAALNTKINEKYGIDNTVEDIEVNYIPSYRLRYIIKPYVVPMLIASMIVFIYMAVRFRKIGAGKVVAQSLVLSIIAELLFVALLAITRYPINGLILPAGIVIYGVILTVLNGMYEKQLSLHE